MAGRRTKFSPERTAKLIEAIQAGMTKKAAAAFAGISEDCLMIWLRTKPAFAQDIENAESYAEARYTGVIAKAAFGHEVKVEKTVTKPDGVVTHTVETRREYDWKAALEWLRRRRRNDWGDKLDVNLDNEIERTLLALQEHQVPVELIEEPEDTIH